jgi:hypothetical protein
LRSNRIPMRRVWVIRARTPSISLIAYISDDVHFQKRRELARTFYAPLLRQFATSVYSVAPRGAGLPLRQPEEPPRRF